MNETSNNRKSSNRASLIIAMAVFLLPVIAAAILHKTGWYSSVGTSNHGNLITPPIPFEELRLSSKNGQPLAADNFKQRWWMVYLLPEQCSQDCSNSLYQMRQVHLALGPEQKRVARLLISTGPLGPDLAQLIEKEFPNLSVAFADKKQLQQVFSDYQNAELMADQLGRIYLVDTMGAVFMYYPTFEQEEESILKGRNLLKDLQKVLKLSKIG